MLAIPLGRLVRAAALLALLAVPACDSLATDPGLTDDGEPAGNVGRILIVNNSAAYVSAVYFEPCGSTLIANRGSVSSGQSRSWSVEPGCYDIKAESSTGYWGPSRGTVPEAGTLTYTLGD